MYGDLHLPLIPSFAGPISVKPVTAWKSIPAFTAACVGGKATAPQLGWLYETPPFPSLLGPEKFKFWIKHPLLTWKTSLVLFWGTIVTNLKSSPDTETSVLSPIGLFST